MKGLSRLPSLVVSDGCGHVFEIPEYRMAGMLLDTRVLPDAADLIELPFGSDLFELPGRVPVGYDVKLQRFAQVPVYRGNRVWAVAAFMAPAYVQCLRSAYVTLPGAPRLSLYSYTAVGWKNGAFVTAGTRIDPDTRQDLCGVDRAVIEKRAIAMLKRKPGNRLVQHLVENCVRRYGCPAARNFVMGRFECPVPTSPACNARCIGCISEQPSNTCVKASQERITFVPTPGEIADFTVPHLQTARRPVISFGQGCEGEPLMVGDVLEEAIREVRKRTSRGVINLNTNASKPAIVERLFHAGLDSIRVSLNSAQKSFYHRYYRPRGYGFEDVVESLRIARKLGRWSSINYFVFPGFTDSVEEVAALDQLIGDVKVNMIQARNMNIDPEWYADSLDFRPASGTLGTRAWVAHIRSKFPWVKFGYFNPPREEMKPKHFAFQGVTANDLAQSV